VWCAVVRAVHVPCVIELMCKGKIMMIMMKAAKEETCWDPLLLERGSQCAGRAWAGGAEVYYKTRDDGRDDGSAGRVQTQTQTQTQTREEYEKPCRPSIPCSKRKTTTTTTHQQQHQVTLILAADRDKPRHASHRHSMMYRTCSTTCRTCIGRSSVMTHRVL
jgi:hypothetical protein